MLLAGYRKFRRVIRSRSVLVLLGGCAAVIGLELVVRAVTPHWTPETVRRGSLEYEVTLFARNAFPQRAQDKRQLAAGLWKPRSLSAFVNEHGYRGRSFPFAKPDGELRVVVLGGSAAFDIFAEYGRDWPHLMEEELHRLGRSRVRVINAGIPGHATWDSLGRLYSEIWMLQPDIVLIYQAWNDIKYFSWIGPQHSLLRGIRPQPRSPRDSTLVANPFIYYSGPIDSLLSRSQLYVRLRTGYYAWRLGKIGLEGQLPQLADSLVLEDTFSDWGPRQYSLNLRLIAEATRAVGGRPVFLTQARLVHPGNSADDLARIKLQTVKLTHAALTRAFAACDSEAVRVGREVDVPVLDLAGPLNGTSEYFHDQVHTTAAGSEAIARRAAELLVPHVDDLAAVTEGRAPSL